jgi:hypothetical protein
MNKNKKNKAFKARRKLIIVNNRNPNLIKVVKGMSLF